MYLPVPGFEPTSSEFLDHKWQMVTHTSTNTVQDGCMSDVCNMIAVILVLDISKYYCFLSFHFVKFEIN